MNNIAYLGQWQAPSSLSLGGLGEASASWQQTPPQMQSQPSLLIHCGSASAWTVWLYGKMRSTHTEWHMLSCSIFPITNEHFVIRRNHAHLWLLYNKMHSLDWHCNIVKIYSKFNGLIKTNLSGEIRFRKKFTQRNPPSLSQLSSMLIITSCVL